MPDILFSKVLIGMEISIRRIILEIDWDVELSMIFL